MADPQTLPLILRNSVTPGAVPAATEFDLNTFVVNRNDGILYWRDQAGAVQSLDLKLRNVTPAGVYVRADIGQNLTGSQRRQAKANLGALGSGYNFLNGASSLTSASMGQLIFMGTGGGAVTLPALASVKDGDILALNSWSGNTIIKSAEASGTAMISFQGQNVDQFTVRQGQSAFLQTDGTRWYVFGYGAVQGDSPSFNEQQSPSQAQKAMARKNSGAGILRPSQMGVSAALAAADLNTMVWISGSGITATLPPVSSVVYGDWIEFTNYTSTASTIAASRANGETSNIYYAGTGGGSATMPIGPGQSVKLWTDGISWVASYRSIIPEMAAALLGAAFTGAISAPAISINSSPLYPTLIVGGVNTNNTTPVLTNAERAYLDVLFNAVGTHFFATMKGGVSNPGGACDIVWIFRLYDQSAGGVLVTSDGSTSTATSGYGATGLANCLMGHNSLTIGRQYLIRIVCYKQQDNSSNVIPRDMALFAVNS